VNRFAITKKRRPKAALLLYYLEHVLIAEDVAQAHTLRVVLGARALPGEQASG
jgi:hypothetical protein